MGQPSGIKPCRHARIGIRTIMGYNMGMAHLPEPTSKSPERTELMNIELAILKAAEEGKTIKDIAYKLVPAGKGTWIKRQKLIVKLEKLVVESPLLTEALFNKGKVRLMTAVPDITDSLSIRAQETGKPDAVRLAFEASGFHNPKVQHEHSGDISISLNIPRPDVPKPQAIESTAVEVPQDT